MQVKKEGNSARLILSPEQQQAMQRALGLGDDLGAACDPVVRRGRPSGGRGRGLPRRVRRDDLLADARKYFKRVDALKGNA